MPPFLGAARARLEASGRRYLLADTRSGGVHAVDRGSCASPRFMSPRTVTRSGSSCESPPSSRAVSSSPSVFPSLAYVIAVPAHGGAFTIRLSTSHDSYVTAAWHHRRRFPLAKHRWSRCLARHAGTSVALDVEDR